MPTSPDWACDMAGQWLQQHKAKPGEKLGILQALEGRLRIALEQEDGRLIGLAPATQVNLLLEALY